MVPDDFVNQGCQIFLDTMCIPKLRKIYQTAMKLPKWQWTIPNASNIHIPNGLRAYQTFQFLPWLPKFTQIGIFGLKIHLL
jgi:hypothetical protein